MRRPDSPINADVLLRSVLASATVLRNMSSALVLPDIKDNILLASSTLRPKLPSILLTSFRPPAEFAPASCSCSNTACCLSACFAATTIAANAACAAMAQGPVLPNVANRNLPPDCAAVANDSAPDVPDVKDLPRLKKELDKSEVARLSVSEWARDALEAALSCTNLLAADRAAATSAGDLPALVACRALLSPAS